MNNTLTEDEKNIIVQLHNEGKNCSVIAERIGRNDSTIGRFLKRNGFEVIGRGKQTKTTIEERDEIRKLYEQGLTGKQIMDLYEDKIKCPETVLNIVKENGEARNRGIVQNANVNYFENIDTPIKAYLLGFILADGNIHKQNRNTEQYLIQIQLQSQDKYILDILKKELESDNKIRFDMKKDLYSFGIKSHKLATDLMIHGIMPQKTGQESLNMQIKEDLFHHYIRGIFDGDGTVYIRNNKYMGLRFGFYGSNTIVNEIHNYLVTNIGLNNVKVIDKGTVSFVIYSTDENIKAFYEYIYKDANVYLIRKKEKFESHFRKI